jgi:RNA polymerase sigma-70 factor (ECF subfamily)
MRLMNKAAAVGPVQTELDIKSNAGGQVAFREVGVQSNGSRRGPAPADDPVEARLRLVVGEVLGGKHERFDEIVAVIGSQVHAIAWRLTQNSEDALDVSQEAFLRIFKALPAWKGRCRFSTWVHRVVLNTAVDYLRRQSKHYRGRVEVPSPADEDEPYEPQEWGGVTDYTPADAMERTELRRRILQAVELLSSRQRKCFMLRHFQELSVREVAETLGTTEGTVKRHLFRASRRLRELLGTD